MNRAFAGAYRKGYAAGKDELSGIRRSCPYLDHRKKCGRLTFARAFRKCWWEGKDDATNGRKSRY